jgi:hypothetical protein
MRTMARIAPVGSTNLTGGRMPEALAAVKSHGSQANVAEAVQQLQDLLKRLSFL